MDAVKEIAAYLRLETGQALLKIGAVTNVRLRAGQPVLAQWPGGEAFLGQPLSPREIQETALMMLKHSAYAWENELGEGFFTLPGGSRVGVAGKFARENGRVRLTSIGSMCVRAALAVPGCAEEIVRALLTPDDASGTDGSFPSAADVSVGAGKGFSGAADVLVEAGGSFLCSGDGSSGAGVRFPSAADVSVGAGEEISSAANFLVGAGEDSSSAGISGTGRPVSALILAPPGAGKTTLLRDAARLISLSGFSVAIADERGEIAACVDGVPVFDVGPRTDVIEGVGKALAIPRLLRAMAPDVIVADEIGSPRDGQALGEAARMGVSVIATAHAASLADALRRPVLREIMFGGAFLRAFVVRPVGRVAEVWQFDKGWKRRTEGENGQSMGCNAGADGVFRAGGAGAGRAENPRRGGNSPADGRNAGAEDDDA